MTKDQWITVTVAKTQGSAPREAGAAMRVFVDGQDGSIGGGALEWEAVGIARKMLSDGETQSQRKFPLGPELGQCCGGSVVLDFIEGALGAEPSGTPLWIWGAGHVGRAIAAMLAPFDAPITLIDTTAERMPDPMPMRVTPLVAADPLRVVGRAPKDADHLIMTYSHTLDLGLCDSLLRHGFRSAGLIGSATKWARFQRRLGALGHTEHKVSRITCPIGDPKLGKHPQAIAIGVANAFLSKQISAR